MGGRALRNRVACRGRGAGASSGPHPASRAPTLWSASGSRGAGGPGRPPPQAAAGMPAGPQAATTASTGAARKAQPGRWDAKAVARVAASAAAAAPRTTAGAWVKPCCREEAGQEKQGAQGDGRGVGRRFVQDRRAERHERCRQRRGTGRTAPRRRGLHGGGEVRQATAGGQLATGSRREEVRAPGRRRTGQGEGQYGGGDRSRTAAGTPPGPSVSAAASRSSPRSAYARSQ